MQIAAAGSKARRGHDVNLVGILNSHADDAEQRIGHIDVVGQFVDVAGRYRIEDFRFAAFGFLRECKTGALTDDENRIEIA